MYKQRREVDMLMDAPEVDSWRELTSRAMQRDYWKARVRAMKQPRVAVEVSGSHFEEGETISFTINS